MLTYALKFGADEGTVVKTLVWEGHAMPEPIRNRPELLPHLTVYWEAFADLSTERGGMGGPIPWSSIHRYGRWLKMSEERVAELHFLIRRMDDCLLEHHRKESEKKR